MSHRQYAFLVGLLIAWLWASAGFLVAVGGVAAGLVGYAIVRVLEGDISLGDLTDRFGSSKRQR
ncbi:hypothetical protein [Actinocatenispora comari]|jgi:hypothetical protein|uniref:DUF2273 domain-containing protein n=1 Tax=Actinocatenispora comari TaxID=2807577 RepID=A0A8J4A503_9ACTN|nr:hypothetical protein [Actinocatenispora comari]GIL24976.1 hypothetical protein NUM_02310 [Actinocatenispora comari]